MGATQGTKAGLEEVIRWVSKGKIKPVIDTILPFSNMVEGHVEMATLATIWKNINYSAETLIGYLEMMHFRFRTTINCIDGRTQERVKMFSGFFHNIFS